MGLVFFFVALQLLSGADYLTGFASGQVEAHVLLSIDAFDYAWLIGLVAFGGHLIVLGHLVTRSVHAPRALGYVLMVAGTAYFADTLARAVVADYADFEGLFLAIVAVPSVIGELSLTVWLLAKAGK